MSTDTLESAVSARGNRLIAFLIDFTLLTIATMLIWGLFLIPRALVGAGSMFGAMAMSEGGGTTVGSAASIGAMILGYGVALLQWVVIGIVLTGYFVFLLKRRGQTLGMMATDVTVRGESGAACTQSQAIKRTGALLAPLPLMALCAVFIPLVGLPIALFMMVGWLLLEAALLVTDDRAQRLGDRVANTVVVEAQN